MPLPLLFIGIAAVCGTAGIGTGIMGGIDQSHASSVNEDANDRIEKAGRNLNLYRIQCGNALRELGEEKLFVLNHGITVFVKLFSELKNVDFRESEGLTELGKLHIDEKEFEEMKSMTGFSASLIEGGVAGITGGALTAFGAYSAASAFAAASTGTAIASLSGAAATNATLAFFGGGSIATGGLGMAGGTAVLGGLVAGPALLVMGIIIGAKAGKNLEDAYANAAKANEICEEFAKGSDQCVAIRRRSYMLYNVLAKVDIYMNSQNSILRKIIEEEGDDYSKFTTESKKQVAAIASTAVTVKALLDLPILKEDGSIDEDSLGRIEELMK